MKMIKKYRKKPVEIEAVQWTGKNDSEVEDFIGDYLAGYGDNLVYYKPKLNQYLSKLMYIRTLEVVMNASVGDYIIKGVQGEFYPCKPDIFEQTYEEVRDGKTEEWPIIEPERKTGKWIRITQGAMPEKYICPFCRRTVESYGVEELLSIRYPYCHCGADMRGELDG